NARLCWALRSTPASAISRHSSLCFGPGSPRARRSTQRCSKHPARLETCVFRSFPRKLESAYKAPCRPKGMLGPAFAGTNGWYGFMTQTDKQRLDNIGLLALVGAGKMGGAMLEGWLA